MRVLIVAGGTGGHIFPALAVANALQEKQVIVDWLGVPSGLEKQIIEGRLPIHYINMSGIRGKGVLTKLLAPFKLLSATWQAWRIIRRLRPSVVLAMGGFISAPAGIAAWLTRIPLVVHEQNSICGYANRLLSKFATTVLQAFPNAFPAGVTVETVGNPVRASFAKIAAPEVRMADHQMPLRILVLGGSQGASAINQQVVQAAALFADPSAIDVWHQAGANKAELVRENYAKMNLKAKVDAFIVDMQQAYEWADLVVCRAGAMTIAELAIAGIASILVPFPYAVDDHQYYNGKYLADAGAAILIRQRDLTPQKLCDWFGQFIQERAKLVDMARSARKMAKPDATTKVEAACFKVGAMSKGKESDGFSKEND